MRCTLALVVLASACWTKAKVTPFAAEDRAVFRELPREAIDAHCCYSRCSPLVVGTAAGAKPPSSLPTPELCMPRPVAGTSVGAPGDPRCPHAVKLDGALRPYVKTFDERCCYDMRM